MFVFVRFLSVRFCPFLENEEEEHWGGGGGGGLSSRMRIEEKEEEEEEEDRGRVELRMFRTYKD